MVLTLAAIAVMLMVGGQDVLAGRTTAGELAAFIFYAFIVAGPSAPSARCGRNSSGPRVPPNGSWNC